MLHQPHLDQLTEWTSGLAHKIGGPLVVTSTGEFAAWSYQATVSEVVVCLYRHPTDGIGPMVWHLVDEAIDEVLRPPRPELLRAVLTTLAHDMA